MLKVGAVVEAEAVPVNAKAEVGGVVGVAEVVGVAAGAAAGAAAGVAAGAEAAGSIVHPHARP